MKPLFIILLFSKKKKEKDKTNKTQTTKLKIKHSPNQHTTFIGSDEKRCNGFKASCVIEIAVYRYNYVCFVSVAPKVSSGFRIRISCPGEGSNEVATHRSSAAAASADCA